MSIIDIRRREERSDERRRGRPVHDHYSAGYKCVDQLRYLLGERNHSLTLFETKVRAIIIMM